MYIAVAHGNLEIADLFLQMRRAPDMYADDCDSQMFKYLNVFARIAECDKWKAVCKNLRLSQKKLATTLWLVFSGFHFRYAHPNV
jgi:hypothetical protein